MKSIVLAKRLWPNPIRSGSRLSAFASRHTSWDNPMAI